MGLFDWVQDWNGNGHPDLGDAYMEYQIFQEVTRESNPDTESSEDED